MAKYVDLSGYTVKIGELCRGIFDNTEVEAYIGIPGVVDRSVDALHWVQFPDRKGLLSFYETELEILKKPEPEEDLFEAEPTVAENAEAPQEFLNTTAAATVATRRGTVAGFRAMRAVVDDAVVGTTMAGEVVEANPDTGRLEIQAIAGDWVEEFRENVIRTMLEGDNLRPTHITEENIRVGQILWNNAVDVRPTAFSMSARVITEEPATTNGN